MNNIFSFSLESLNKVFSRRNIQILEQLGKGSMYVRELAGELKCAPAKVHSAVTLFKKLDLIKEEKKRNMRIISLNQSNILLAQIRALINVYKLINSKSYKELKKLGKIGIYGSFANGADTLQSDIDLWLYSNTTNLRQTSPIIKEMESELKKEVNLLLLTNKKLKEYFKKDPEFYNRLKLTSKCLDGDIFVY